MSNEIFDNFIKIALDKGIITKDPIKKTAKDNGSSDISSIEALYGVQPKLPSGTKQKRNIIEEAHPNSVIISPSYDKINGLVENNNERQDIILNILNKTPTGVVTNHKYAEKELILSLVRLGNDLDNRDSEKLRVLSDTCLEQVANKPIKKEAWALPVVGITAAIGGLWLQQHLPMRHREFNKDSIQLIAEIDDMLGDKSEWKIYGNNYSAELTSTLNKFKNNLIAVSNQYTNVLSIINQLEKPRDAKELMEISQHPTVLSIDKAVNDFKLAFANVLTFINTVEENFKNQSYKARHTESQGIVNETIDRTQIFHGGKGLIADDFDDVVRAITPYKESVKEIINTLSAHTSLEADAKAKLEHAQAEFPTESATAPSTSPSTKTPDEETKSGLGIKGLTDKMKGVLPKIF